MSKDEICEQCCVNEKGISNTRLVIQTSFLIKWKKKNKLYKINGNWTSTHTVTAPSIQVTVISKLLISVVIIPLKLPIIVIAM